LTLIEHPFADHHALRRDELAFPDDHPILMTEKDAMRCAALASARMWSVPVAAQFDAAASDGLLARVLQVCRAQPARAR
jgi:tetraacyldisaccharide 4'-kinase